MKILLTGATGFVGQELGLRLARAGHSLRVLTRKPDTYRHRLSFPAELFAWDPLRERAPRAAMEGCDAVIHLAGETVAGARWSAQQKRAILESREVGTRNLMDTLRSLGNAAPRVVLGASAIGIYGDRGDDVLSEDSPHGSGFLADVCKRWEHELFSGAPEGVRTVAIRIGIVLAPHGGALAKMLPVIQTGFGGRLGNGKQWMSWISLHDLVSLFEFALLQNTLSGPVNGVAPHPETNATFTAKLAKQLGVPAIFPAPAFALRLVLGEMSEILLASQKVSSAKAEAAGFRFRHTHLHHALTDLLGAYRNDRSEEFVGQQWLPLPPERVFGFFKNPHNLESLTPSWLNFEVLSPAETQITAGTGLDYKLRIHGVPMRWRSRIDQWKENQEFCDHQEQGPYNKWQHTHRFEPLAGGTLMTDVVHYRVPMGHLGRLLALPLVRHDVKRIFAYRQQSIAQLLGEGKI